MAHRTKPPKVIWPSWRYGPNETSMICNNEAEVPEGWTSKPWTTETQIEQAEIVVLNRAQIIQDLEVKNIVVDPRRSTAYLQGLL